MRGGESQKTNPGRSYLHSARTGQLGLRYSDSCRLTDEPDRLLLRVDLVHLALVHLRLALEVAGEETSRLEDGPRSERADSDGGKERGEEEVVAGRDDDLVSRDSRLRQCSSALQYRPSCSIRRCVVGGGGRIEVCRTHDVVTGVVEFLEERGAGPAVSEHDDGRQFRVMRKLLARVPLVVTAPEDVAAAGDDGDQDGAGKRPETVLGLLGRRGRLGTPAAAAATRGGRSSRLGDGTRRGRFDDGRATVDLSADDGVGVQRRRRRRVGGRGLLDQVGVLQPTGRSRSEGERALGRRYRSQSSIRARTRTSETKVISTHAGLCAGRAITRERLTSDAREWHPDHHRCVQGRRECSRSSENDRKKKHEMTESRSILASRSSCILVSRIFHS